MDTHLRRFARLCWLAFLAITPLAFGTDADNDGIDDAIDPHPASADAKTTINGPGYTLTVLGSNRVCSLQVSGDLFSAWNLLNSTNADQAAIVTKIYEQFGDAFDFLIFVNNTATSSAPANQAYNVRNDVRGIGVELYDNTASVGSAGALQTFIRMASKNAFTTGPILHEILHRWSAFLSTIPTRENDTHWYFAGVGGQHFGWEPGTLVDLGGGRYKAGSPGPFSRFGVASSDFGYGKFDLYLMGLIPANQVPEIKVADNPSIPDSTAFNERGEFAASGIRTIPMDSVIFENGERLPNVTNSQKFFHSLFVILTTEPVQDADWVAYDRQAYEFSLPADDGNPNFNFWEATGGRAEMSMNFINYDLKTFSNPRIFGPDVPDVGVPATYTFPAIEGATGYDRQIRRLQTSTFKDGAENGADNFTAVITGGYNVASNVFPRSGSKSFRLTHIDGKDQFLTLNRVLKPQASSKLKFFSRVGESGNGEFAMVEVRSEGRPWQTVFNQKGSNAGENDYSPKSVSLGDFAGETIEIRFQWRVNGSYTIDFLGNDSRFGWYIDDIELADCEEVTNTTVSDLGNNLSFTYTRPENGRTAIQVRGRIGKRNLRWGPEKFVGTAAGANTPPVAVDDILDIRGATKLDLTANDTDADGDRLRIIGVTQGSKGTVRLKQSVVTYSAGVLFDGEDTFTYTVSDGRGGDATASVTVRNPFPPLAGKYSAAITEGGTPVGRIDVSITAGGSVSGKVFLDGKSYPLKGLLTGDGVLTVDIKRKSLPTLTLTLEIDRPGGLPTISGTADSGALVIVSNTILAGEPSALAPAGRYTLLLPGGTSAGLPRGTGYALGTMSRKGVLKLVGRLADYTPFSTAVALRADDTALVNFPLYKNPKGYLYGTLAFANKAGSDVSGTLAWSKPIHNPAGALYPGGFTTNTAVSGSIYLSPLAGERTLVYDNPTAASADVGFSGPELPDALTQTVDVSSTDKITITGENPIALKLTINRSTGLFSGTYLPAGASKKIPFSGALLQKSNVGAGVAPGTAETTQVTFMP